jgi:hypothetical protein
MLPTYSEWKRATASARHRRSDTLVAIDEALKRYERSKSSLDHSRLKDALHLWKKAQKEKGQLWERSVRNKTGMVTRLNRELDNVFDRSLTPEDLEALRYIARIQSMALAKQFESVEVAFKSHTLMGIRTTIKENWDQIKAGGKTGIKGNWELVKGVGKTALKGGGMAKGAVKNAQGLHNFSKVGQAGINATKTAGLKTQLEQLCKTLCPNKDPNEVFQALGLPPVSQFSADLAPIVGALTSGVSAVMAWAKVIKLQWQKDGVGKSRYAFAPQDPEAAFEAVMDLLDRETNAQAVRAGVKSAAFGGKIAGAFLDAGGATGPAIGIGESIAAIMQMIYEYVRDVHEVDNANELIRLGALNFDLFGVCPVLGCYFLVMQDHSTIVNYAVGQYGQNGWNGDVEQLMMKVDPVLGHAQRFIHQSRFEIAAFQRYKGVVKQSGYLKGPLGSYVREGQIRPVGLEIQDKVEHAKGRASDGWAALKGRVQAWRASPTRPPEKDPKKLLVEL